MKDDINGDQLRFILNISIWISGKVDVAQLFVGCTEPQQPTRDPVQAQDIAIVDCEKTAQSADVANRLGA